MIAIPPDPVSAQPVSPTPPANENRPVKLAATRSLHGVFLEKNAPQWLTDATTQRRDALKNVSTVLPSWYQDATPAQRTALSDSFKASVDAQNRLDKRMSTFQPVEAFAKPLLIKALKDQYQVQVDVEKTLLCLKRPVEMGVLKIELASFELFKLSLLDAALHNFEAYECAADAFHSTSGFVVATTTPDTYESVSPGLTVSQFLGLCRRLDIGKQYQTYLQGFFHPTDAAAEAELRERFISSQKATLRAAAEQALLQKDIEPADHAMIVSVIDGQMHPWIGEKPVWFADLGVMKKRMTGCVVFDICEKYRYSDEVIVYIPHDPEHPLKRYSSAQMRDEFKRLLTARDAAQASSAQPTSYQRFLSQFLPYDQRPYYFSQFTKKADDSPNDAWRLKRNPWLAFIESITPGSVFSRIRELPPERNVKLVPEPDPYIAASTVSREGRGIWAPNQDLWEYLYKQNCKKVLADARSHAVPTADVDVKAREAKLAHLMQIGMLGLNMVSMFVPVLGEVMMVVMAGQLLYETLEGAIEWSEGDRRAAKDHLIDVAENLAQIVVMAGVGVGVRKFSAASAVPVIEQLSPVKLPNGQTRLWKPDLGAYESTVTLEASPGPNTQGQYVIDGKTFIRQDGKVYEQFYDESISKWRIRHPTDASAYQPVLESNGRGAWRHSLERPLAWDRLTLLRRMGHVTDVFSDAELIKAGDISGVSDNALRKMHLDKAAPPPELTQAMQLFKADADTARVMEQLQGTQPIDEMYFYALPLVTEMPRWPANRVLEVFEGPQMSGKSVKYGSERRVRGVSVKVPIQVTRPEILSGDMPARILAQLDESEITRLLGGEGARVHDARPAEFGKQMAAHAQTRQPAIHDSIYKGTEPVDARVTLLQNACPGLSDAAAQEILAHSHTDDLARLGSPHRVPLRMLEDARWYARRSRQVTAYAGLRSENIASADSRHLALRTLERLPGWPDNVRLEVREGKDSGTLLDSIGSETAREKKYLIKKGPQFQAFNDRGEELNSLPRSAGNFYASIMHALPDDARRSLGMPEVSQWPELQKKIIEYADQHYSTTLAFLEPQGKWFKAPVRVSETLTGYAASGRGPRLNPALSARARDIYPDLTERQADDFILGRVRAGDNESQIAQMLQDRLLEWNNLETTLDQWVEHSTAARGEQGHRLRAAQALKACWRKAPLAAEMPGADQLAFITYDPLPALAADFTHVRELTIGGNGMTDGNAEAFLALLPNVEKLSLGQRSNHYGIYALQQMALTTLPEAVTRMASLKSLKFRTAAPALAISFPARLRALTGLEELHLNYAGLFTPAPVLDLAPLTHLEKIKIEGLSLVQWPAYVQGLPALQRLDLSRTAISSIPDSLYTGHERLWAGLSLDWSRFSHEAFKPAYEYVKKYMGEFGHLVDLDLMVRRYCAGELEFLTGEAGHINPLPARIMNLWNTPETRLNAVEALRAEHAGIFRQFYHPTASDGLRTTMLLPRWQTQPNVRVLRALEKNWRAAIRKRYSLDSNVQPPGPLERELPVNRDDAGVFELYDSTWTQNEITVSELPRLPAGTFSHVRTVRFDRMVAPVEQVRDFLMAFSGVRNLEITSSVLTEVPFRPGDLAQLTRLDLSFNQIESTPALQSRINGLVNLEHLSMRLNRLTELDVSGLTRLKTLNLSSNALGAWPRGAENLPQLKWLDLRYNNIAALPKSVLGHADMLLRTSLMTNNPFSVEGAAALTAAQGRIESARGLPIGALGQFDLQPVPLLMPPGEMPAETAFSLVERLLPPLLETTVVEGPTGFAQRVQDLNPIISPEEAQQCVARLRLEGLTDAGIDARLREWQETAVSMTRELNGWIFAREANVYGSLVSAYSREMAALKIRECWQDGVTGHADGAGQTLNLTGVHTGDLPPLSTVLSHVRTLNLTGTRFTLQSFSGFCRAFPEVTTLTLNGNALEVLPGGVGNLSQLSRLELSGNRFGDAQSLYSQVGGDRLRWLDLSHNRLDDFNASAFSRLETLNLANNGLQHWPDGIMELEHLQTLNLTLNRIMNIPGWLLGGAHQPLVAGTDLSENPLLLNSLEQLRDYSVANDGRPVMGLSRATLDHEIVQRQLHADSESDFDYESGSGSDDSDDSDDSDGGGAGGGAAVVPGADVHAGVEALEVIANPQHDVAAPAMETWLTYTPVDARSARQKMWQQLAQEANHESFFHLLSTLHDTAEFRLAGGDLTHRVWQVIQAASENTELRELLFANAETHGTCPDGRILSFSELETRVYVYTALRDIPRHRADLRGRALLDMTRRLFRLDRVDRLAEAVAVNQDRAEVRLQYRIGMIRGWPDGLELPAQPEHMLYGTPIRGRRLINARASVLADEASNIFVEDLSARDYWGVYLQEQYPAEFQALEQNAARRMEEVEDAHPDRNDSAESLQTYLDAMQALRIELADARSATLQALTRQEMQKLAGAHEEGPQPGPSSPQPGPSWRP
ncbi:hypothetical protein PspR84_16840 [Pseudomonas sp. R84]|uniref:NEL-type E3 ubiquitin ligase domain-containing protein n=1 Tax=Pseudomonas sp. R84 TaxID=1573712 RepID=UPI00131F93A8|nr:NEL-type E3 ubiquitin ligase domain-containing protein [Pseudomonas sp. R84]QHC96233.1 hypothetical protein PspR84_16840 [Pseudomonas sp. R84]